MKTKNYTKTNSTTIYYIVVLISFFFSKEINAQVFTAAPVSSPYNISALPYEGVFQPTFIDIDNDGDYDLVIGRSNSSQRFIELLENIGSAANPDFATPVTLITAPISNAPYNNWVCLPAFFDKDGDGDYDLIVGRGDYNGLPNIEVYENSGTSVAHAFTTTPILQTMANVYAPVFIDFDNDGDMDLFTGDEPDYTNPVLEVSYYKNSGTLTNPNFQFLALSPVVTGNGATYPAVGDLDLDGNIDLILGENTSNIQFYTSNNAGNFSSNGILVTVNNGAHSHPTLVDINDDGDLDLFVGLETELLFFENTHVSTTSIENQVNNNVIAVYPNPTRNVIQFNETDISAYKVYDVFGRIVLANNLENTTQIDVQNIDKGTYFVKLFGNENTIYTSKFIKN